LTFRNFSPTDGCDLLTSCIQHDDDGFTLLEALVALLILALSLGVLFQHLSINSDKFARSQYSKSVSQLLGQLNTREQIKRVIENEFTRGESGPLNWAMKTDAQDGLEEIVALTIVIEDDTGRNKPLFFKRLVSPNDYLRIEKETDG